MSATARFNADTRGLQPLSRDGVVLFDLEHDRLLKLNSVGAEMWQRLGAGSTESQIIDSIAEQYGVDKTTVAADLRALIRRMAELGVEPGRSGTTEPEQLPAQHSAGPSIRSREQDASLPEPTASSVVCAIFGLALFDLILWTSSLKWLCRAVQAWRLKRPSPKDTPTVIEQVCSAVESGCVWYPKKALCLQRSAVLACLLRNHGIAARMVIGARPMPFLAHAWVEVEGSVVNDFPRVKHFYHLLDSY